MYSISLNHSTYLGEDGNLPLSRLMNSNDSIRSNPIYCKAVQLQLISPNGINCNIQNFEAGSLILRKSSSVQGITCITVIEIRDAENIPRKLQVEWSAEINPINSNQLICKSKEGFFSVDNLVGFLINYRSQINELKCDSIQNIEKKVKLFNYRGELIGDVPLDELIDLIYY